MAAANDAEVGDPWALSAHEVVALLKRGAVTPLELLAVVEERVAALNPAVNAVPILCMERARQAAEKLVIPEEVCGSSHCEY